MEKKNHHILVTFALLLLILHQQSFATQHLVGDSIWTIPPTNNFYTNWSSSQVFFPGDTLYFDFDPEFYNVMQVSRREYGYCTANQPYKVFSDGPVNITLMEVGVFYYICSILNYCSLGQKFSVTVLQNSSNNSAPTSSPSPSPLPSY
ncbi:mavicyanin-like [Lycium barbarum]|uniref:mavicyanin-like n=1 Tax=Lycium barbarum TaxID=112863 RepID=UPI00293F26C6|nr:mavicyanin-like [Lycium barbarum]